MCLIPVGFALPPRGMLTGGWLAEEQAGSGDVCSGRGTAGTAPVLPAPLAPPARPVSATAPPAHASLLSRIVFPPYSTQKKGLQASLDASDLRPSAVHTSAHMALLGV